MAQQPHHDGDAASLVSVLLSALGNKDAEVRRRAVEALGKIGASATQIDLAEQCTEAARRAISDEAASVRRQAAESLAIIAWHHPVGGAMEGAVSPLGAALRDRDRAVRASAARSLGFVLLSAPRGARSSAGVEIVRVLARDEEASVRLNAACGLVGIGSALGDGKLVEQGVRVLLHGTEGVDTFALAEVYFSLGYLACAVQDPSALAPLVPTLNGSLASDDRRTRLGGAVGSLGIGAALHEDPAQREGMDVLTRFLTDEPVWSWRYQAASTLADLVPFVTDGVALATAVRALSASLTDVVPQVRQQAATALAGIPVQQAQTVPAGQ